MAHQLETTADGRASFAYNVKGGHPWHRLGVQLEGLQTIDTMLKEARADYDIVTFPVMMQTPSGLIAVEGQMATARPHPLAGQPILDADGNQVIEMTADGVGPAFYPAFQHLGIVSEGRYQISGHRQLMRVAYAIVEADEHERRVDTMGVLEDGKRFFAYVKDQEPVVLDPGGIAEVHEGGLGIHTRHDGHGSTALFWSLIRIVCNNTVTMAENTADAVYRLGHHVDLDDLVAVAGQARIALGLANEWTTEYLRTAEQLLRVPVTTGIFNKVVQSIWPKDEGLTDRQRKLRLTFEHTMESLFEGERAAGSAGFNGHAAVQAIGEFMDHRRNAGGNADEARARASLGLNGVRSGGRSNAAVKELATKVVLEMAGPRLVTV